MSRSLPYISWLSCMTEMATCSTNHAPMQHHKCNPIPRSAQSDWVTCIFCIINHAPMQSIAAWWRIILRLLILYNKWFTSSKPAANCTCLLITLMWSLYLLFMHVILYSTSAECLLLDWILYAEAITSSFNISSFMDKDILHGLICQQCPTTSSYSLRVWCHVSHSHILLQVLTIYSYNIIYFWNGA